MQGNPGAIYSYNQKVLITESSGVQDKPREKLQIGECSGKLKYMAMV